MIIIPLLAIGQLLYLEKLARIKFQIRMQTLQVFKHARMTFLSKLLCSIPCTLSFCWSQFSPELLRVWLCYNQLDLIENFLWYQNSCVGNESRECEFWCVSITGEVCVPLLYSLSWREPCAVLSRYILLFISLP